MGRRTWIILTGSLLWLGLLTPAQADGPGGNDVSAEARTRHAAAVAYWTPQRVARAIPATPVIGGADRAAAPDGGINCNKKENRNLPECGGGSGGGGDDGTGDGETGINCNKRENRELPECTGDGGGGGGDGGGTTPSLPTTSGAPWTGSGYDTADSDVRHLTGKVLFTLGATDYVCSGGAVTDGATDDGRALVVTAGHCTHEGDNLTWATNWTFLPDFDADVDGSVFTCGDSPHGCWTAAALVTTNDWALGGHLDYDVGFAVVDVGGHDGTSLLEDVLADQGAAPAAIGFNRPRGEFVASFGYPHAAPYDGRSLTFCAGDAIPYHWLLNQVLLFSYSQGLACDMTGGASGGPWYAEFDVATGTGVVMSVNSYKMTDDPNTMYGTFFGNYAQATYEAALVATSDTRVLRPAAIP